MPLNRRGFLRGCSALSLAWMLEERAPVLAQPMRLERIRRAKSPILLETPLAALDQPTTPTELFYVRNHFAQPELQAGTWRLAVVGAVERELNLTLEELRRMTSRSVSMTLECAGNSRSSITPVQRGVQWAN